MNYASVTNKPTAFNFRRWSRKGYAVFASLGRLVRIATLKTVVSTGLACKEVTIAPFSTSSNTDEDDGGEWLLAQPEVPFISTLITQILGIQTIAKTNACGIAAPACTIIKRTPLALADGVFYSPSVICCALKPLYYRTCGLLVCKKHLHYDNSTNRNP